MSQQVDSLFLPDFCALRAIWRSLVAAELTAMLVVMAQGGQNGLPVGVNFVLVSLYLLWIALVSMGVLCRARPWLATLSPIWAAISAWLMLMTVTMVIAEVAYQVGSSMVGAPWFRPDEHGLFLARNFCISALISAMALRYLWLRHEHLIQLQAESQARLSALEARIRPHFLFNSLNSVAALIAVRPEQAEDMVLDLSDLFRATLNDRRQWVPLNDELALCQTYIRVEEIRMEDRLRVEWQISEDAKMMLVPVLSIQPLLENAVYHGIEQMPEGGTVAVKALVNDGKLVVSVSNPIPDLASSHRGSGTALENITARLRLKHGDSASMKAVRENGQYEVRMTIPFIEPNLASETES